MRLKIFNVFLSSPPFCLQFSIHEDKNPFFIKIEGYFVLQFLISTVLAIKFTLPRKRAEFVGSSA